MKTHVSVVHPDHPSRAREIIETKLQSLDRFYQRLISVRAHSECVRDEHRVEIVANVGRGMVLVADGRSDGFGSALERSFDKMVRQLKRLHGKQVERRRRPRR